MGKSSGVGCVGDKDRKDSSNGSKDRVCLRSLGNPANRPLIRSRGSMYQPLDSARTGLLVTCGGSVGLKAQGSLGELKKLGGKNSI